MIICQWKKDNRYLVNPDGQVYQCCYFKESLDLPKWQDLFQKGWHPWVDEYIDNKEKYNLDNSTIDEILNSDLFSKKLPDTWKDPDTAPPPCQKYCRKVK